MLDHLEAAIAHWDKADPVLANAARRPIEGMGYGQETGFTALVESICHQQVSMAAGRAILGRVQSLGTTPEALLEAGPDALRAAGLSRPKVTYVLDLATRTAAGDLDFNALEALDDAAVIDALVEVKGIGIWTAKMYLIFRLRRLDVCPYEDLGVRLGVRDLYGVAEDAAAAFLKERAPVWSPYNSLAALVLWNLRD